MFSPKVAGTRVYEDRREQSLQIMKETKGKRERIQEVISYIDERLSELQVANIILILVRLLNFFLLL